MGGLVLAGALVIALMAVLLITNLGGDDGDVPFSLQRPAAGEARPDYLADGMPIWVIGHEGGSVDILSGFDTHVPAGVHKLLWWCPGSRTLDDPRHGSRWDEYGVKLDGPAPAGLGSWVVSLQGSRVFVGESHPPPPLGAPNDGRPDEHCTNEDQPIIHAFTGWQVWDSPTDAVEASPAGWILIDGGLAPQRDGTVMLCSLAGCGDAVVADGVQAPTPEVLALDPWPDTRYLARVRDGRLVDLTQIVRLEGARP